MRFVKLRLSEKSFCLETGRAYGIIMDRRGTNENTAKGEQTVTDEKVIGNRKPADMKTDKGSGCRADRKTCSVCGAVLPYGTKDRLCRACMEAMLIDECQ